MGNFESGLSAISPESGMDQTAVKPLSRGPANSTVLIGWVWVWGWVSTGYGVARCSESVESRRGVGQLDLLVS